MIVSNRMPPGAPTGSLPRRDYPTPPSAFGGRRTGRRPALRFCLLLGALALGACDSGPVVPEQPDLAVDSLRLEARDSANLPALRIFLASPAGAEVRYWADGQNPTLFRSVSEPAREHTVTLTRLKPDTRYTVEVRATGSAGTGEAAVTTFTTLPLPADLAALELTATGRPSNPLTMLEIFANPGGFEGAVVVDEEGEIVWWRRIRQLTGFTRRENGNFVFLSWVEGLLEVDPSEGVVNRLPHPSDDHRMHHDVIATPDNTLLYVTYDRQRVDGRELVADAVWEWSPERGENVKRWSAANHFDPAVDWGGDSSEDDWLHANSVSLGPRGNVLVSFRFIHQVVSISSDFSEVEYRLGGIGTDFAIPESDRFVGQHTATEFTGPNGTTRVLVFDNGSLTRSWSRALELELDPESSTARSVWEYAAPNENFSYIVGLARRLENGNTFVTFGAGPDVAGSHGPVAVVEATPGESTQWRLEIGGAPTESGFVLYRASPLAGLGAEVEED